MEPLGDHRLTWSYGLNSPQHSTMQITIEIPDDIAQRLDRNQADLSRQLLEFAIADAYRCGKINTAEVGKLLELPNRLATHAFLKRMGVYLNYDEMELTQDLQTLKAISAQ